MRQVIMKDEAFHCGMTIEKPSNTSGFISFTTNVLARYGERATYDFRTDENGTEFLMVHVEVPESYYDRELKEWNKLLKRHGIRV